MVPRISLDGATVTEMDPTTLDELVSSMDIGDDIFDGIDLPDSLLVNEADAVTGARTLREQLLDPTDADLAQIKTMLAKRVTDGHGETLYDLGSDDGGHDFAFTDDELTRAYATLETAAKQIGAFALHLTANDSVTKSRHVLIRRVPRSVQDMLEVRVAVVGNVDAGKSTTLGVLTKNVLDDGRGKARVNLFRHKHEIESGRTSSVGTEIMGFDKIKGDVISTPATGRKLTWEDICTRASKVVSFLDLAGHEKYLKTTVFGMTGCAPNYVLLLVAANAGVIGMTKEHLGLALALNVPVLVVVTKIDMCPQPVLQETISQLTKLLKSSGCRKIPIFVKTVDDVVVTAGNFGSERVCPIFQVSNVTGTGLDLLRMFLSVLPLQGSFAADQSFEYHVNETFSVPFVGTVVNGVVESGAIHVGDTVLIGPDSTGQFIKTAVKSIQRKRINVPCATAGQTASLALKKIKRTQVRKGQVMLPATTTNEHGTVIPVAEMPRACRRFEAEVLVLYHSTTIAIKYQAMLHCGPIRQTVRIVKVLEKEVLRTGDRARVVFEFLAHPEYIKPGQRLVFREGRTKGLGKVIAPVFD